MDVGTINQNIITDEKDKVLRKRSNNKAPGIDNLPLETLKNTTYVMLSLWRKAIVKLNPKGCTKDPHVPLQYR